VDQFAFRPSGSITSAIVSLIHHITNTLATEPHVHIIALDFSKAFDVTRHSILFDKLAGVPLPDHIYAWLLDFFNNRSHKTRLNSSTSTVLGINRSVVQGSALGPPFVYY